MIVEFMAEWAIRSSILIVCGALGLWLFRVKDSSSRAMAWTALLFGSLLIPILSIPALRSTLPGTHIPAMWRTEAGVVMRPTVPTMAVEPAPVPVAPPQPIEVPSLDRVANSPATVSRAFDLPGFAFTRIDWSRLALALYIVVSSIMALRVCAGLFFGARLLRRSRPTGQVIGQIAIHECTDLAAPMTVGILRRAIVLPADWRKWESERLNAVIAHERCHIQRHDPWVQLLSAAHRALLWGSPVPWFLHQRILEAAEDASDDAAMAAIEDHVSYAETLLHFMQRGAWNAGVAGISMARHGNPERRIRRILSRSSFSSVVARWKLAAIAAIASSLGYVIATAQVLPQFDIADVHVSASSTSPFQSMRGGGIRVGLYEVQNATMVDLIKTAYGLDANKVTGGPSWLELDRYDVFAKASPSTSADTAKLMLQALLRDRFRLALHKDSRPLPGFTLTLGRNGAPKLKRAAGVGDAGCKGTPQYTDAEVLARRQTLIQAGKNPYVPQTYLFTCRNMTMAAFAEGLQRMSNLGQSTTVTDRTGLTGEWDFDFRYSSQPPLSAAGLGIDGENITITDALDRQLGLKLESAGIPTPVLVVDSVNRKPTENPPDVKAILPPPLPPAFEVAVLRLSAPNASEARSRGPQPGGRFEVRNFPLSFLLMMAWNLPTNSALTGTPEWLSSLRVDLSAKLPSTDETQAVTGVADMDLFAPALRALLVERFKVAIHTEQRPAPGYALVSAKPKMRKATPTLRTKCFEGPGADGKDPRISNPLLSRLVTCQNTTIPEFLTQLRGLSGGYIHNEPLIDASAIEGAYDFTLSFSAPAQAMKAVPPEAADPSGLTLFEALEKQLGLKLEKRNVAAQVVVLDHIEEKPNEN